MSGHFITIEGGEGSGKSTLIHNLQRHFEQQGLPVIVTREPGGSPLSEAIRKLLLQHQADLSISPFAELLLFLAARAQHLEELIRPALREGKVIICDRFSDSTLAYQGAARQLDLDLVHRLCRAVCKETEPDLTLLLDIDPRVGLSRAKKSRQKVDRMEMETLPFHDKVREAFLALAKKYPERIVLIDAKQTPKQVLKQAIEALKKVQIGGK